MSNADINDEQLTADLDAAHAAAIDAFSEKDVSAYRDCFTPDVEYTQADGRVIGRDQLMRDVQAQFNRVHSLGTSYSRQSLTKHSDDRVTETLTQSAWIKLRVFVFFTIHWSVERSGDYSWRKVDGLWKLERVIVRSENVS